MKHQADACAILLALPNWVRASALGVLASLAIVLAGLPAEAYPEKPIRMVVPLPPGGAVDIVARLIQPHLEKSLGQPVIVDNRPGASGTIGATTVANADPDGHVLLVVPTTFTINPAVRAKLPFDPRKSFEPIAIVGRNSLLILVNPDVKATTLKEFVELAKAKPGAINYATPGASSQAHLLLELWSLQAGIKMQHIPYRGGAPAVLATVSGEAQLTLISPTASLPQIEAKRLRPLATGGEQREEQLPDVPTTAQAGFPDFTALQWVGILTTGGTPKAVVDRLNSEVQRIVKLDSVKARLNELGMTVVGGPPDNFRKLIDREIRQWTEVARKANIKSK